MERRAERGAHESGESSGAICREAHRRRRTWSESRHFTSVADIQGIPFAFTTSEQVTALTDGKLGDLMRPELAGAGVYLIPFGGMEKAKGFWFNVNAELIIYGATEPNAKVTLGGHEIKLRSDGTFSFRFALPDGKYDLPAVAVSADGTDARAADLKFSRETEYLGDVGAHPQDPSLKTPLPENL